MCVLKQCIKWFANKSPSLCKSPVANEIATSPGPFTSSPARTQKKAAESQEEEILFSTDAEGSVGLRIRSHGGVVHLARDECKMHQA